MAERVYKPSEPLPASGVYRVDHNGTAKATRSRCCKAKSFPPAPSAKTECASPSNIAPIVCMTIRTFGAGEMSSSMSNVVTAGDKMRHGKVQSSQTSGLTLSCYQHSAVPVVVGRGFPLVLPASSCLLQIRSPQRGLTSRREDKFQLQAGHVKDSGHSGRHGGERRYRAGEAVRQSGIYEVIHDREHRVAHEVVMISGESFPDCESCKENVRFRLIRTAPYIFQDEDFEEGSN